MNKKSQSISRRRFLSDATISAGSALLFCGAGELRAVSRPEPGEVRSTDHFWYRLAPREPYIDSQRDCKAFGYTDSEILLSEDNGNTWPHRAPFADAKNILFSCILGNGNILFATQAKLYLSTDNLRTYEEITVLDTDGSAYIPHTPRDPARPGWYFHPLNGVHTWNFVDGRLYWAADANGPKRGQSYDRGIFRCDPADLPDPEKHALLFDPEYESANMIIEDGVILSAHYAPASFYATGFIFSPDMGKTWAQYDLKELGPRSPVRFHKKNSDGWFRVDLRKGWIERGEVLFIKPK